MYRRNYYLIICLLLSGCYIDEGPTTFPIETVDGYKPIYISEDEFIDIGFVENVPLNNPGKIYIYGQFLLVGEKSRGVHIYDNTDPTNPDHVGFINIPGNDDIALKGNILYADQGNDLVAIDVSDVTAPVVVDRKEDIYNEDDTLPPGGSNYFECVDKARAHLIVGWEWTTLNNPECFR